MRGLTRADADVMTIGGGIDYIIEWNKMTEDARDAAEGDARGTGTGAGTRKATQADIDRLAAM